MGKRRNWLVPESVMGELGHRHGEREAKAGDGVLVSLSTVLALSATLLLAPARAAATTLYAAPTAQGSGNCSSWADACTLATALSNATSGDEIWVKMGVHYPGTNRTDTFTLKNGVQVYGGFNGTESTLNQRNWRGNLTILSGDIDKNDNHGGDDINENASQIVGNNAYHVVTGGGTNSSAVLDGFVITAGQANGSAFPDNAGGGMLNQSSSPTLRNLTFSGNSATTGGGMLNQNSSPTLTNVTFSGNSASFGGGIYNWLDRNPKLMNVTFSGNSAANGGGMYNNSSNPTLTNVTFSGNSAAEGGGMYNYEGSNPTLTNVIIWGNSGGEIVNVEFSSPTISYSLLQGSGCPANATCGSGMIYNTDPQFVDADGADNTVGTLDDNLRLQLSSPAIDKGTNDGCPDTDLDGNPRPVDGDGDDTATCDMGAYEMQAALTPTPSTTPTPTRTQTRTVTPTPPDGDRDGVPDPVEDAAPNNGDGNGDWRADKEQAHVGSLPGARGGGYQTMVTDASCPIRNLRAVALSPPGFHLPFGALAFELECESTRVTIYYHAVEELSAPPYTYVKQGPNPPGASNNLVYTLSRSEPHHLEFGSVDLGFDWMGYAAFTLRDNVLGDDTGDDDRIVDQGGPGFPNAAPAPVGSGWALVGSLLALLGVAWRRLWRR